MTPQEMMLAWLNDAYSMEQGIVQVLERQVTSAADHPQVQAGLEKHLAETRQHAELVQECITRLGGSTSAVKTGMAAIGGAMQGMTAKLAQDELLKNALQDYGTEHFEIACYTSLREAARALGDTQTAQVAERILADEMKMAQQLLELIPTLTTEMLVTQGEPAAVR